MNMAPILYFSECPSGFYGTDCVYKCSKNCNKTSRCNRFTGECEGGCKPGWIGAMCYQSTVYVWLRRKLKGHQSITNCPSSRFLSAILCLNCLFTTTGPEKTNLTQRILCHFLMKMIWKYLIFIDTF